MLSGKCAEVGGGYWAAGPKRSPRGASGLISHFWIFALLWAIAAWSITVCPTNIVVGNLWTENSPFFWGLGLSTSFVHSWWTRRLDMSDFIGLGVWGLTLCYFGQARDLNLWSVMVLVLTSVTLYPPCGLGVGQIGRGMRTGR